MASRALSGKVGVLAQIVHCVDDSGGGILVGMRIVLLANGNVFVPGITDLAI